MKIAFLGLGAMGVRMAANLLAAGHDITVWNRSPGTAVPLLERGASGAASPRDAATGADTVIAMLRDDEASRAVWLDPADGAFRGMARHAMAIECSTLTPEHIARLAEDGAVRGIRMVDAPLAGSRPQAEARQLVFMAGGAAEDVARATPLLLAMGSAVHHAGPSGSGAAVKLALNALFGIQVAAVAEVIGSLRRAGVDAATAVDIMGSTAVASPAAKGAAAAMLAGNFAPQFPIALAEKDFGYFAALATRSGSATPLANAARGVLQMAIGRGGAGDNITGVMRLYE
jgi:3-hydroxyisobutyrate dehydrogenase